MGSIIDGQPVNALVTNTSKLDRQTDDTAFGIITLANTDTASGAQVDNVQADINAVWQDKKFYLYLDNDGLFTWDGAQLSFSEDFIIAFKDSNITNTILATNSPISISDGYSVYVTINRSTTVNLIPVVTNSLPKGKNIIRLATRVGSSLVMGDNTYAISGQTFRIGSAASASSNAIIKVKLYDPLSTTLPSGATATIDGVAVANNDDVLFTNLTTFNNRIYRASGVGVAITWAPQTVFNGLVTPSDGDTVRILQGTLFSDQQALFDGTNFSVNKTIRLFNGVDNWELNSIVTSTLSNNTTGNVFTVGYVNSENIIVNYSVIRNTAKTIGTLLIVTDGTTATVTDTSNPLSDVGISFSADISGSDLRLRYTTDNSGSSATMKYYLARWSDNVGGPSGVPSYTVGSSPVSAAGANTQIQYNAGGLLAADSDFTFDAGTNVLQLGSIERTGLSSSTASDNVSMPANIITVDKTLYKFLIIDYSLERNNSARHGTLRINHDGTNASISDDFLELSNTDLTGIIFSATISGSNLIVQYISTNTGFNATMKYNMKRWI